jgi:hypothetical protein
MGGLMGHMPTVVSTQAFDSSQFTYAAAHKSFGAFRKQQGSSMLVDDSQG